MKITRATSEYEDWLGKQLKINELDLLQKHINMSSDSFIFLRATYYRWAQIWQDRVSDLADAPIVLSIGDLHIENFGTWRDAEGRLIWGVNDFDEVYDLPYTNDLLRLATSAKLAAALNHLTIGTADICEELLSGYARALETGGRPFVLGESHPELRKMAIGILRDPVHFWRKLNTQNSILNKSDLPEEALDAIEAMLPEKALKPNYYARQAGQGSLGRQRFVAIADYRGGSISREVKALAPSACAWAEEKKDGKISYDKMLKQAIRCHDQFLAVQGKWIVRRLAPDCSRIDLSTLPQERDERVLLNAMGFELGNIHLGSKNAVANILTDLNQRTKGWLANAARLMAEEVNDDWNSWREKNT